MKKNCEKNSVFSNFLKLEQQHHVADAGEIGAVCLGGFEAVNP